VKKLPNKKNKKLNGMMLLQGIQMQLKNNSNAESLAATQKFVPGSNRVYGVRMPVLNALAKLNKEGGFGLVKDLWDAGAFEEKMLAAKLLGLIAKKNPEKTLDFIQYFANGIDNWALCDTIGMQSLKPIVKTHSDDIFTLAQKYNPASNFWQRRLSLVMVEWFTRDKAFHPQIKRLIEPLQNDPEYYVRKAVDWMNKNFAKGK
jgi:3-methyladenine DNA glycosylase AlkD